MEKFIHWFSVGDTLNICQLVSLNLYHYFIPSTPHFSTVEIVSLNYICFDKMILEKNLKDNIHSHALYLN